MSVPPPYDPPQYDPPPPPWAAQPSVPPYPAYPSPTYPSQSYPSQSYSYPGHPYVPPRTNALAIASLVCAFLFAPLGIVFGHLSLSQIRRSGEDGRGLAIAGLVIGYVVTIATIVALVAGTLLFAWAARVIRESSDPGGAGIPRYHAAAPLTAPSLVGAGHPIDVVDTLDITHRVQHMPEMFGVAHLKGEAADGNSVV